MVKRYSGVGDRLKWLQKHGPLARFTTVREMCKHLNLKNSTWYDWTGDKYYPKGSIIIWLEREGINLKWLETGRGSPYVTGSTFSPNVDSFIKVTSDQCVGHHKALLVKNIAYYGIPYVSWSNDEASPQMTGDFWSVRDGELLAVTVEGDSMSGAHPDAIQSGDTVLVRLSCIPRNNETWIVRCLIRGGNWSNWGIRRVFLLDEISVSLQPYHVNFDIIERPLKEVQFLAKIEYRIR